jgi:hypothetical protein
VNTDPARYSATVTVEALDERTPCMRLASTRRDDDG